MNTRRARLLKAACRVIARHGVRGLRVEDVASEAGVSKALIYYHFRDRAGLIAAALDYVHERATVYEAEPLEGSGRDALRRQLVSEFQDDPEVREISAVWGEVRAAGTFDAALRPVLAQVGERWIVDLAELIEGGCEDGSIPGPLDARATATRLTALVEGLSSRWLAGLMTTAEAREHVTASMDRELGLAGSRTC